MVCFVMAIFSRHLEGFLRLWTILESQVGEIGSLVSEEFGYFLPVRCFAVFESMG